MAFLLAVALAGCTATQDMAAPGYRLTGPVAIVVPRGDVELGRISMGGVAQHDAERTAAARAALSAALAAYLRAQGDRAVPLPEPVPADYEALHRTVATAIALHKYGEVPLPTKKRRFDWTLGPGLRGAIGAQGDHALFLSVRSYRSDDARKAMAVAGAVGCVVGLCLLPGGGEHIAYASLVDLKSGNVVWFNVMTGGVGDPATAEGAKALVERLLSTMRGRR
ncbi:hypothetical protein [Sphingomonas sp. Y38-1Y]|uniref:hypothetical protein n=1 Tax=Sphingomonas sp. Y38-1Y TaxID=3078265 RepID=UPI0028E772B7|nr:hypothetical protein [Sphingomonas sp. Y38-1Y]